jgi:hypothetical protein
MFCLLITFFLNSWWKKLLSVVTKHLSRSDNIQSMLSGNPVEEILHLKVHRLQTMLWWSAHITRDLSRQLWLFWWSDRSCRWHIWRIGKVWRKNTQVHWLEQWRHWNLQSWEFLSLGVLRYIEISLMISSCIVPLLARWATGIKITLPVRSNLSGLWWTHGLRCQC